MLPNTLEAYDIGRTEPLRFGGMLLNLNLAEQKARITRYQAE